MFSWTRRARSQNETVVPDVGNRLIVNKCLGWNVSYTILDDFLCMRTALCLYATRVYFIGRIRILTLSRLLSLKTVVVFIVHVSCTYTQTVNSYYFGYLLSVTVSNSISYEWNYRMVFNYFLVDESFWLYANNCKIPLAHVVSKY